VLYTLVWGARSAFRFGLGVTLTTAAIGLVVGLVSGYVGGTFGNVTMRVTDAFLAFPVIAAVWVIQQAFYSTIYSPFVLREEWSQFDHWLYESRIDPIFVALILFSWMPYARIMHTLTAQARRTEYVQAAEAMGARTPRLLFYHILPNIVAPAVVMAARDIGAMVLLASAFIFIGFGGNVAWGTILVGSRDYVVGVAGNPFQYWWTFVPISLAIVLFGAGWNLLGDGLNDYLNPHRR
jgi:peptide/nickel transport system permease protein